MACRRMSWAFEPVSSLRKGSRVSHGARVGRGGREHAHESATVDEVQDDLVLGTSSARERDPATGRAVDLDLGDPVARALEVRAAVHEVVGAVAVEDDARLGDVQAAEDELGELDDEVGERRATEDPDRARAPAQDGVGEDDADGEDDDCAQRGESAVLTVEEDGEDAHMWGRTTARKWRTRRSVSAWSGAARTRSRRILRSC